MTRRYLKTIDIRLCIFYNVLKKTNLQTIETMIKPSKNIQYDRILSSFQSLNQQHFPDKEKNNLP
jgi:hypothetical protein